MKAAVLSLFILTGLNVQGQISIDNLAVEITVEQVGFNVVATATVNFSPSSWLVAQENVSTSGTPTADGTAGRLTFGDWSGSAGRTYTVLYSPVSFAGPLNFFPNGYDASFDHFFYGDSGSGPIFGIITDTDGAAYGLTSYRGPVMFIDSATVGTESFQSTSVFENRNFDLFGEFGSRTWFWQKPDSEGTISFAGMTAAFGPVPEPSSFGLLSLGVLVFWASRRRFCS